MRWGAGPPNEKFDWSVEVLLLQPADSYLGIFGIALLAVG